MKKLIMLLVITLIGLTSCKKDTIIPNNPVVVESGYSILNDDYEDEWTLNISYYYDNAGNYISNEIDGQITITDTTIIINHPDYSEPQILNYTVATFITTSEFCNIDIEGYGVITSSGVVYSMTHNSNNNSLILVIPTEIGSPYTNNNEYKLLKANR